jgi:hypothetical protein
MAHLCLPLARQQSGSVAALVASGKAAATGKKPMTLKTNAANHRCTLTIVTGGVVDFKLVNQLPVNRIRFVYSALPGKRLRARAAGVRQPASQIAVVGQLRKRGGYFSDIFGVN